MDTEIRAQLHTIEDSLQRYLPESLCHTLLEGPGPAALQPCLTHLDALLHAVSTYLPRYLVNEQLADLRPGQVSGQFRQATLLFADISGFTAMSERLSRQGQQGAEAIANIVGDYFSAMLDIADDQGGDLLKFGGDALLIAFFDDDPAADAGHALRACRAATQMQRAMDRFESTEALGETFRLRMTVGLGSGPLFTAHLGTRNKMEYTVMGEALANMAHAEDQARGGEILIDEATCRAARGSIEVGEARGGRTSTGHCYRLVRADGGESRRTLARRPSRPPSGRSPAWDWKDTAGAQQAHGTEGTLGRALASVRDTVARLDTLVPYLPPGLLDLLRFDPRRMAGRERGEFRPVTVAFANFYGIEEIIQQLGPGREAEITAILNAHFSRMQQIIDRYGGVIDKVDSYVVGHRIMALFGAPRAHVDDPERAVRAAWEMQAAMSAFYALETSAGVYALKQRIGINTGRVFAGNVGSDLRHEYSVMGDEVNLTARLMSAAQDGQVLISQSTAEQVGPRFIMDEQAPVQVKGKSQPVPNYDVRGIAAHGIAAHGVAARRAGQQPLHRPPLVGRDEEWQTLWQTAQSVLDGTGEAMAGACRMLDIHGEMGMGKSRIVQELVSRWSEHGGATYLAACVSYGRHTPYAPWVVILNDLLSLHESNSIEERRRKITNRLEAVPPQWADGLHPADWAPLIAQLLGVPMPENELVQSLDPSLRQQNLQRIVYGLLRTQAHRQPTLLVIDDIQWIDQASLELLNRVIEHSKPLGDAGRQPDAERYPMLFCVVHRPTGAEEDPDEGQPHQIVPGCTTLSLDALSEAGSLALLESQLPIARPIQRSAEDTADEARWQRLKELILKNAQGNPLFIVEMAHALIENYLQYDAKNGVYRARSDLDRVQVPDTVSRVILSRLDRLDEQSRTMLKIASVIGREFQRWLLQSVYPYPTGEAELEANLLDLCAKDILDRSEVMYLFRHVMTREVAYESLLYAERRDLHRRIARSIEEQSREDRIHPADVWRPADTVHPADTLHPAAEALAQHYTLAEEWPQALRYQLQAGRRARAIYANGDAIHRFREALRIVERVPEADTVHPADAVHPWEQQLIACEQLSEVLAIVGEYDEALAYNDRAIALVMEQGASAETAARHLADLFRKTASIYEKKSEYETAFDWLQGGLIALEGMEAVEAARIYLMGAGIYHRQGDNAQALQWCQHSLDIADRPGERDPSRVNVLAHACYLQGAIYLRYGDYALAIEVCRRSLDLYQQLGNLSEAGSAHNNLASAYFYRGDWVRATEHYAQALAIKTQIGDVHECGLISNNLGGVYLNRGQLDEAEDLYRQSLQTWQKLGSTYGEAFLHMNLAAVALKRRQWAHALELLAESQKRVAQVGARDLLPEVYRYVAEAHLGLATSEDTRRATSIRHGVRPAPKGRDQVDQAQKWAERSLAIAQEHEVKLEEGDTRRVLGQVYRAQGDWQAAERELEASLALLESLNSQYQVGQTLYQLAQLHADVSHPPGMRQEPRARQELDRAIAIFEQLGAQLDLERAQERKRKDARM
jgi:class 3 adenylate cyclase/predicted ATPase